jgi:hypothetical protein
MAITNAIMQMRRGNEIDFDPDKMHPGEWAVSTDKKIVRMCFYPGVCVRMATYEAFEEDMKQIQSILSEARTIQEAVRRINTEVSSNAQAVAEYTKQAKQYRDEAKMYKEQASAIVGVDIATENIPGLMAGGDNAVAEDGTLVLTKTTTERTLKKSKAGGLKVNRVDGESRQKQYSGKNHINFPNFTLTAGASDNYRWIVNVVTTKLKPNTTYTLSFYSDFTTTGISAMFANNASGGKVGVNMFRKLSDGRWINTITTPDDVTNYSYLLIYAGQQGGTAGNTVKVWDIQIEEGSTATEYEPYVGNQPSPNPSYPQDIKSVVVEEIKGHGKNLVSNEYVKLYASNDTKKFATADIVRSALIRVKPNTTYLLCRKGGMVHSTIGYSEKEPVLGDDCISMRYIGTTENISITTPSNANYLVWYHSSSSAMATEVFCYETTETSAEYEPYTEKSIQLSAPITLRGIGDVKDTICKQDGVYGVLRNVAQKTISATNGVSDIYANTVRWYSQVFSDRKGGSYTNGLCDKFIISASADKEVEHAMFNKDEQYKGFMYFFTNKSRLSASAETTEAYYTALNTWLKENPVMVQYVLATPTFEPLPLADQIALHQLETFDTITHILTDSAVEPVIEVEYGTSFAGAYAIKGMNTAEANRLEIEQLKATTLSLSNAVLESEV